MQMCCQSRRVSSVASSLMALNAWLPSFFGQIVESVAAFDG